MRAPLAPHAPTWPTLCPCSPHQLSRLPISTPAPRHRPSPTAHRAERVPQRGMCAGLPGGQHLLLPRRGPRPQPLLRAPPRGRRREARRRRRRGGGEAPRAAGAGARSLQGAWSRGAGARTRCWNSCPGGCRPIAARRILCDPPLLAPPLSAGAGHAVGSRRVRRRALRVADELVRFRPARRMPPPSRPLSCLASRVGSFHRRLAADRRRDEEAVRAQDTSGGFESLLVRGGLDEPPTATAAVSSSSSAAGHHKHSFPHSESPPAASSFSLLRFILCPLLQ